MAENTNAIWWVWETEYPEDGGGMYEAPNEEAAKAAYLDGITGADELPEVSAKRVTAREVGELYGRIEEMLDALGASARSLARSIECDLEEPGIGCAAIYGRVGKDGCGCGFCERVAAERQARAAIARARSEVAA